MATRRQTPVGRYPDQRRRGVIWVSGLVGVIALGWLGWVIAEQSNPEVTSVLKTWKIVDDHRVDATITVRLGAKDVRATCLLRAFSVDKSVVGETNLSVPTGRTDQDVAGSLRTERRATSVELVGCTAPGQRSAR